jgi:hypothetical protein
MNRTPELLAELRNEIRSAPPSDLLSIRGQFAALEAEILARLTMTHLTQVLSEETGEDSLIGVKAAAEKMDVSERFLYEHAEEYGGAKYGATLKFSVKRLDAIIRRRSYG